MQVVFVVGAGASKAFGLPAALELKGQALSFRRLEANIRSLAEVLGTATTRVHGFFDDLAAHPDRSIDDFLFNRSDQPDVQAFGRVLIARLMGEAIVSAFQTGAMWPQDRDWPAVLTGSIAERASSFNEFRDAAAAITFVTFNFDSVIEDQIGDLVSRRYGRSVISASEASSVFAVHHVHGKLPPIPDGPTREWLELAAPAVHVTHDSPKDEEPLRAARLAIRSAGVVYFLGFGFHHANIERLKFRELFGDTSKIVKAYATAVQLHDADLAQAKRRLGIKKDRFWTSQGCTELLQTYGVLRE